MTINIEPYSPSQRTAILALALKAWAPVFEKLKPAVQDYVYRNFYPKGWEVRQSEDIAAFLDTNSEQVLVALNGVQVTGSVGTRQHREDRMGEIYMLAVAPDSQRQGIALTLIDAALACLRTSGMAMVMIETGDDPGHAPSRAAYERAGFVRWPVARYFKDLC